MSQKASLTAPQIRLHCQGLSHAYGAVIALKSISLQQEGPSCVALIGSNGAGKSTLLRGLVGAQRLSRGEITLDRQAIYPESAVRSELGYLSEKTPLPPELSVYEYLSGIAGLHRISHSSRPQMLERCLTDCDLINLSDRRCDTLSRGQRQRVGLAAALIHQPKLLVLDEVHSGLDPLQTREINSVLKSISSKSLIVLSTHRLSAAEEIADHYWVLHEGELLTSKSATKWKREWHTSHQRQWSLERAYLSLISER